MKRQHFCWNSQHVLFRVRLTPSSRGDYRARKTDCFDRKGQKRPKNGKEPPGGLLSQVLRGMHKSRTTILKTKSTYSENKINIYDLQALNNVLLFLCYSVFFYAQPNQKRYYYERAENQYTGRP